MTHHLTISHHFEREIQEYAAASTSNAVYITGGNGDEIVDTIAEFKNDRWRKIGNLTKPRKYHGSIAAGGLTIIIGGRTPDST